MAERRFNHMVPAFFRTPIYLSVINRLRVLVHGTIVYHGVIKPDPGDFEVEARIEVPGVIPRRKPETGYGENTDE